jgi:hypothetical protein
VQLAQGQPAQGPSTPEDERARCIGSPDDRDSGAVLSKRHAYCRVGGVVLRLAGLALTILYAALVVWLYAAQPQTVAQVTGGLSSSVGAYRVDPQATADAMGFFRRGAYAEARAAFERADPAHQDARTQFYMAYTYYRQGWGRVYNDDTLFRKGIETVDLAISLAPAHRLVVDDPDLGMQTADELRAELERGVTREASDFNPLKVFRPRK